MPNQSFTDPVLYGRPRPCRTKSESQASTSQLRQADRCQGKRKALARPSSAMAIAGHPPGQATPRQALAGANSHQGKLPPQLRQQTGAKASARRSLYQTAPEQSQDTHRGKLPPSKPTKASNARPSGARYTNRNRQPQWRPAISVAEIRNY